MDNSSQAKSIELLQTTIEQLQTVLEQIKTTPGENLPNLVELEKLRNSSQNLAREIAIPSSPKPQPLVIDRPEKQPTPSPQPPQPQKKAWLPVLLGSIVAIMIIGISVTLLKSTPPKISTDSVEIVQTVETPTTPEVIQPPRPIAPKAVVIPTTPPPQLETKPVQGLIAAIQTEVDEITDKYTENLISLVEADFLKGLLIIEVGTDWYQLTPDQQQQMANQILQRSQILSFRKLEIRDTQGITLARNPVVGESMVMTP